jgi:hypothetical protein
MEVIIKRVDNQDRGNEPGSDLHSGPVSVADEIRKLADLRDAGLISEDDFQKQKNHLLQR